jgi:hypothetical protein
VFIYANDRLGVFVLPHKDFAIFRPHVLELLLGCFLARLIHELPRAESYLLKNAQLEFLLP